MLIQPDSLIRLIKNCPIDNSYKDTIYFETLEEQLDYFRNTLPGINFVKQSYQRYADGVLTVQAKADEVYDCNYLMFRNSAFGTKWFYAFVNSVEYVNNVTVRVYYEIDVIQTYMFDIRDYIHPCFVERQHCLMDNIGDNLIPESFDIGEYVERSSQKFGAINLTDLSVVFEYQDVSENALLPSGKWEYNGVVYAYKITTGFYGKNFCHTNYIYFPVINENLAGAIAAFITATNILTLGGLLNVYIMPTEVMEKFNNPQWNNTFPFIKAISTTRPTEYIGQHKVVNKKLLTYPYCCLNIKGDTDSGKFLDFDLLGKDVNGLENAVYINCPIGENANLIAYPAKYKEMVCPVEYAIQTSSFPVCRFVTEKLGEWIANNSIRMIGTAITAAAVALTGSASAGMSVSSARKFFEEHAPIIADEGHANIYPQRIQDTHTINMAAREGVLRGLRTPSKNKANNYTIIGNIINNGLASLSGSNVQSNGGGSALFSSVGGGVITVSVYTIREHIAKMIDDYFTMFGYAVKSIQYPSFNVRDNFTYIKTNGFSVHGGAPSEVLSQIGNIHDSGITYWKKDSVIGDYTQDNRPLLEKSIVIVSQPTNCITNIGDTATFTVIATGSNLTYQWEYWSNSNQRWIALSGQTTNKLIREITGGGSYDVQYRCVITNSFGNTAVTDTVKAIKP